MWIGLDDLMEYMNHINNIFPRRHSYATTYTTTSYSSMTKNNNNKKQKKRQNTIL